MKVSVIVPAWGGTPYLEEALASIEAQTVRDFEVIRCEPPPGPKTAVAARLAGVARAVGEWIMFVDADDTLLPDAIEKLLAQVGEQTDVVVSGLIRDGKKKLWPHDVWDAGPSDIFNAMVAKLFRRTLFEGIVRDESVELGEDLMVTAQLLSRARQIAVVPDAFYRYRTNYGSVTHSLDGRKRVADLMRVDEILRRELPDSRYSDFHDRVTRDAMLLWCRYRLLDRSMWRKLRLRLNGGLLSDPRHGMVKRSALLLANLIWG